MIGPEVTVGCLGVFITHYNSIRTLPRPCRTQIRKTAENNNEHPLLNIPLLNPIGPVWAGPYPRKGAVMYYYYYVMQP